MLIRDLPMKIVTVVSGSCGGVYENLCVPTELGKNGACSGENACS